MKWDRQVREEAAAHLRQTRPRRMPGLPLRELLTFTQPGSPRAGRSGVARSPHQGPLDKDTQVDFIVRIECRRCGYNMLFDSARFYGSDIPAFEAERVADEDMAGGITAGAQGSRLVAAAGTSFGHNAPLTTACEFPTVRAGGGASTIGPLPLSAR